MRLTIALFGVSLLAACSNSSATVAPAAPNGSAGSRILPNNGELARSLELVWPQAVFGNHLRHLFLSDAVFNNVTIFSRGGKTRTLTGFNEPQGITTDGTATLYVADTINQRVQEFAPPYPNSPSGSLPTPGEWPVSVAVATNGTVAAVIICQASGSQCGANGSVEFFANNHAASPCAIVPTDSKISRPLWAAFDAGGTLYVGGVNNYATARIERITGGCSATSLSVLQPSTSISFVGGVQVDTLGRLAIIDSRGFSGAPSLDVFAPPKPASTKLKLLSQAPLNNSSVVSSFALRNDDKELYTAEPHYSLEYPYPGGGNTMAQFKPPGGGDLIEGVAVDPAESP
jgi:hypothetical protein